MTKDEALRLALEFISSISPAFICEASHHKKHEQHASNEPCPHVAKQKQVYKEIKATLEAKDDRPLCTAAMFDKWFLAKSGLDPNTPLYTTPPQQEAKDEPVAYLPPTASPENACYTEPQRTWVGLTDEEINAAASCQSWKPFAKAIEAKLKEKNT